MGSTGALVQPRGCVCTSVTHKHLCSHICTRTCAYLCAHTDVPAHTSEHTHTARAHTSVPVPIPAHSHLHTHRGTGWPAATPACPRLSTHLHHSVLPHARGCTHTSHTHPHLCVYAHTSVHVGVCTAPHRSLQGCVYSCTHTCAHTEHAQLHIWHTRALTQQHTAEGSTHSPRYTSTKEHVT